MLTRTRLVLVLLVCLSVSALAGLGGRLSWTHRALAIQQPSQHQQGLKRSSLDDSVALTWYNKISKLRGQLQDEVAHFVSHGSAAVRSAWTGDGKLSQLRLDLPGPDPVAFPVISTHDANISEFEAWKVIPHASLEEALSDPTMTYADEADALCAASGLFAFRPSRQSRRFKLLPQYIDAFLILPSREGAQRQRASGEHDALVELRIRELWDDIDTFVILDVVYSNRPAALLYHTLIVPSPQDSDDEQQLLLQAQSEISYILNNQVKPRIGSMVIQSLHNEIPSRQALSLLKRCTGYPSLLHLALEPTRHRFQASSEARLSRALAPDATWKAVAQTVDALRMAYFERFNASHSSRQSVYILAHAGWQCHHCHLDPTRASCSTASWISSTSQAPSIPWRTLRHHRDAQHLPIGPFALGMPQAAADKFAHLRPCDTSLPPPPIHRRARRQNRHS
ncbi:hypothetical protein E5Q_04847 [Mixia osmundae IAM 14324]|uniref:Uncharacterized protein n=1 Tax=Mixia osmundae (strain CBS 9802 / IAM 14324 / JCM 22182 / KY 12970) TaxID=764103 RepID=G7E5Q4_MIXOS|nr:hypothetical protein E5Q_04847 [Mixia osmundae IAM 14324]